MMKVNNVLVIEPHPDDGIMGCGGTIAKLLRLNPNINVYDMYFCPCIEDPKNKGNLDEHKKSLQILGVKEIIYAGTMSRNGYLETHKQECRDILYNIRNRVDWDIVFCPTPHDFHQDHNVIPECVLTIFRETSSILGYEVLKSVKPSFTPNVFITLDKEDAEKKLDALRVWKSQIGYRYGFDINIFEITMRNHGHKVKVEYAEAFELLWGRV